MPTFDFTMGILDFKRNVVAIVDELVPTTALTYVQGWGAIPYTETYPCAVVKAVEPTIYETDSSCGIRETLSLTVRVFIDTQNNLSAEDQRLDLIDKLRDKLLQYRNSIPNVLMLDLVSTEPFDLDEQRPLIGFSLNVRGIILTDF